VDTELLKTFLEVTKTRHFGRAADNLYLTQSAVSFRIRQLESQLGNPNLNSQIAIGASPLLWEFDGISDWINRVYGAVPGLALRLESVAREGMAEILMCF